MAVRSDQFPSLSLLYSPTRARKRRAVLLATGLAALWPLRDCGAGRATRVGTPIDRYTTTIVRAQRNGKVAHSPAITTATCYRSGSLV